MSIVLLLFYIQPLKSSEEVLILDGGRRLHLPNAHPSNEGVYSCVAGNSAGTATKSFTVNVYGKSTASYNRHRECGECTWCS